MPAPADVADGLTIADVMRRGVIFCQREATVREIADTMIAGGVHSVAVLGHTRNDRHDPTVWGIVSDVDLVGAAVDRDGTATAGDLAHEPVIVIRSTRPLREAAEAMAAHRANHLVVIDPDTQAPVGFIAPLDIAKARLPGAAAPATASPTLPTEGNARL